MVKELRRQDITFEMKDQPLRDDVRILGTLVGDLLRDQGGEALTILEHDDVREGSVGGEALRRAPRGGSREAPGRAPRQGPLRGAAGGRRPSGRADRAGFRRVADALVWLGLARYQRGGHRRAIHIAPTPRVNRERPSHRA